MAAIIRPHPRARNRCEGVEDPAPGYALPGPSLIIAHSHYTTHGYDGSVGCD